MKEHYVYEHWLDGQCFYVGKGSYSSNRAYNFYNCCRNEDWVNYVSNRHNEIKVVIVKEFEDEDEAYDYEKIVSEKRLLQNYPLQCRMIGKDKTTEKFINFRKGKKFPEHSKKMSGEGNPMFGKKRLDISEKFRGNGNPMFGITGEEHPMYNKKHTEESRKKISENHVDVSGINNPMAKSVVLTDINLNILQEFSLVKYALNGSWKNNLKGFKGAGFLRKQMREKTSFEGYYLLYKNEWEKIKNAKNI